MPSPVSLMRASTRLCSPLIASITSPTVLASLPKVLRSAVCVTPALLVTLTSPSEIPLPPLRLASSVAVPIDCRASEPESLAVTAALTSIPKAFAVSVPPTLAMTSVPAPPLSSVTTKPVREALTAAVTSTAEEALIVEITSPKVSAVAKLIVAECPARSVTAIEPSTPRPCPPLRDDSSVSRSPATSRPPCSVAPSTLLASPRSSAAVEATPFSTVNDPAPAVKSLS